MIYIYWSDFICILLIYHYGRSMRLSYLNSIVSSHFWISAALSLFNHLTIPDRKSSRIPYAVRFFAPYGSTRPLGRPRARESLKNPRLRVKRKTGRRGGGWKGPGYLSRGAAITSVTSIPGLWTGQKFYEVIFSERKGYVHSYPSHVGSHGVILRPVLNAPRRSPGWPGGSPRVEPDTGTHVCACVCIHRAVAPLVIFFCKSPDYPPE